MDTPKTWNAKVGDTFPLIEIIHHNCTEPTYYYGCTILKIYKTGYTVMAAAGVWRYYNGKYNKDIPGIYGLCKERITKMLPNKTYALKPKP